jgi:hypothetical protein
MLVPYPAHRHRNLLSVPEVGLEPTRCSRTTGF